jgi:hypothetical protein
MMIVEYKSLKMNAQQQLFSWVHFCLIILPTMKHTKKCIHIKYVLPSSKQLLFETFLASINNQHITLQVHEKKPSSKVSII